MRQGKAKSQGLEAILIYPTTFVMQGILLLGLGVLFS